MDERGRFFYIIGASGVGKDTLIDFARERIAGDRPVVFCHRYITRPAEQGGEDFIHLDEAEFENRRRLGLFALDWKSHGYCYGVGIEIHQWLARGLGVVLNGSRGYLPQAASRYPELCPILITVAPGTLAERLRRRGRETEAEIEERLRRARALEEVSHPRLITIDNSSTVEAAGGRLVEVLCRGC